MASPAPSLSDSSLIGSSLLRSSVDISESENYSVIENSVGEDSPLFCTSCKTEAGRAVARCNDCTDYLCDNCVLAHQYMLCFDEHKVIILNDLAEGEFNIEKLLWCPSHKKETLRFFCRTCDMPVCKECTDVDHPKGLHNCDTIFEVGRGHIEILADLSQQNKAKLNYLRNYSKSVDYFTSRLQMQYHKAQAEINKTFNFYSCVLAQRKEDLMKGLEDMFNNKMVSLSLTRSKIQEMVERMQQISVFADRIMKFSSTSEILMFKHLLYTELQSVVEYNPDVNMQYMNLEFLSNYKAIRDSVVNTFGYIRHNSEGVQSANPLPISRLNGEVNSDRSIQYRHVYEPNNFKKFSTSLINIKPYEKLPSDTFANGTADSRHAKTTETAIDLQSKFTSTGMHPLKSEIERKFMKYYCTFGEYGDVDGQFNEPQGVAVNAQNDIVVADTNNHRIQVFDKEGRFKFQFGSYGARDGQLLYPNRVAVVKTSGDIILTERSPAHQVQIYNQYGQFVRKFGANILQHPRGITVDVNGRIIVIDCKVKRVILFDQHGNVLHELNCYKHLEFPNGVAANDKQEIFISDNIAHCVKVFNYDGLYLRQIGGEGLTNYPIGVCINQNSEIVVADNHSKFNITVYTQNGQLVRASVSKVKHAKCFDVALMDDGSLVLPCNNYRLYIYRYMQIPSIAI